MICPSCQTQTFAEPVYFYSQSGREEIASFQRCKCGKTIGKPISTTGASESLTSALWARMCALRRFWCEKGPDGLLRVPVAHVELPAMTKIEPEVRVVTVDPVISNANQPDPVEFEEEYPG